MDENNRLILTQKPNLPILVAIGSSVLSFLYFINVTIGTLFLLIAYGAWFTWAWLEIFQGINYVRRIMGGVVMMALLIVTMVTLHYFWHIG